MGWRIQTFCFLVKAGMKDRGGNKTARIAEGRNGNWWDWSWEACSRWREHEETDVVKCC